MSYEIPPNYYDIIKLQTKTTTTTNNNNNINSDKLNKLTCNIFQQDGLNLKLGCVITPNKPTSISK